MGGWCVLDIAVSPLDWHTVLAITKYDRESTDAGIWRSSDGGNNWTLVHQFPPFPPNAAVGQLIWAPGSDTTVYAAGGSALAVSNDGGATFQDVFPWGGGPSKNVNHVAVSRTTPAAQTRAIVYALGSGVMFVSSDGGTTWVQDSSFPPPEMNGVGAPVGTANSQAPSVLVISPRSPFEVYVVANDASLWRGDYIVSCFVRAAHKFSRMSIAGHCGISVIYHPRFAVSISRLP
jgi:photosystem II stability/assembly factor-like uncharacterized protein